MEYDSSQLSEEQRRIVEYFINNIESKTYFKARDIANGTGLSTKAVGANIVEIRNVDDLPLHIEKWAKSSSYTWKVTADE